MLFYSIETHFNQRYRRDHFEFFQIFEYFEQQILKNQRNHASQLYGFYPYYILHQHLLVPWLTARRTYSLTVPVDTKYHLKSQRLDRCHPVPFMAEDILLPAVATPP